MGKREHAHTLPIIFNLVTLLPYLFYEERCPFISFIKLWVQENNILDRNLPSIIDNQGPNPQLKSLKDKTK